MYEINFVVRDYATRQDLRKTVINEFLEEQPGSGSDEKTSRYRYYVETLADGRRVYLKRPAALNKGFDFTIHVERGGFTFGRDPTLPTHKDIMTDLANKKRDNEQSYKKLHKAIERIYNCEDPDVILQEYGNISFNVGYPVDLILKVIKWFFIEQDMTYWNWSGRAMFMNGVRGLKE